jgi:hypothetical protein
MKRRWVLAIHQRREIPSPIIAVIQDDFGEQHEDGACDNEDMAIAITAMYENNGFSPDKPGTYSSHLS